MNSQPISPSSQLSNPSPELVYGNGRALVRLWTILPGQQVNLESHPIAHRQQLILVSGSLSVNSQDLPKAKMIDPTTVNPITNEGLAKKENVQAWIAENRSSQPALLLELLQGEDLQRVALPSITETRPWGSFTVLKDEPAYKLKQLINLPGSRLSLQRHQKREEHWFILAGHPEITLDENIYHPKAGDYIHIPLHSWHRLSNLNPADEPVELIELQLGDYFGEDDIERCQDDYGRA
jgi:mannose-6-phosphate isomerase